MPGEATRFDGSRATLDREASTTYDFDGDGEFDTTVLGRLTEDAEGNDLFQQAVEGETPEVQGVWLSRKLPLGVFGRDSPVEEWVGFDLEKADWVCPLWRGCEIRYWTEILRKHVQAFVEPHRTVSEIIWEPPGPEEGGPKVPLAVKWADNGPDFRVFWAGRA